MTNPTPPTEAGEAHNCEDNITNGCIWCGAPQCCSKCCNETTAKLISQPPSRREADELQELLMNFLDIFDRWESKDQGTGSITYTRGDLNELFALRLELRKIMIHSPIRSLQSSLAIAESALKWIEIYHIEGKNGIPVKSMAAERATQALQSIHSSQTK